MKVTTWETLLQTTPFHLHGVTSESFQLLRAPSGSSKRSLKACNTNPVTTKYPPKQSEKISSIYIPTTRVFIQACQIELGNAHNNETANLTWPVSLNRREQGKSNLQNSQPPRLCSSMPEEEKQPRIPTPQSTKNHLSAPFLTP
jgi:hypothetical protein